MSFENVDDGRTQMTDAWLYYKLTNYDERICFYGVFGRLIQHQQEIILSFNTPTVRHSASA